MTLSRGGNLECHKVDKRMTLNPLASSSASLMRLARLCTVCTKYVFCIVRYGSANHYDGLLWQSSSHIAIFVEFCINTGLPAIHVGG